MRSVILILLLAAGCNHQPATVIVEPKTPVIAFAPEPKPLTSVHGKKIKETYTAKCVGVVDGDTIDVLTAENEQVRIRLDSIDCPEKKQAFGSRAKEHLSGLVFGREVSVYRTGMHFERQVAFVLVGEEDVCAAMVRDGYAWEYDKYSKSETLEQVEQEARDAGRGLWGGSESPVEPWKFRKQK